MAFEIPHFCHSQSSVQFKCPLLESVLTSVQNDKHLMGQCSPVHPLKVKLQVTVKQTALLLCVWEVMGSNILPQTQSAPDSLWFFPVPGLTSGLYLKLGHCFFLWHPVQSANYSTFNATHSVLLTPPLNVV